MVLFFFVVGLEIKRELTEGELRDPRQAALPIIAAFGGMIVPAAIFAALNAGGEGSKGWGIPMATDIAIVMGVVALLGSRAPSWLKLFLLALAIVDDIGAILVIAVFYSEGVSFGWLAIAIGCGGGGGLDQEQRAVDRRLRRARRDLLARLARGPRASHARRCRVRPARHRSPRAATAT